MAASCARVWMSIRHLLVVVVVAALVLPLPSFHCCPSRLAYSVVAIAPTVRGVRATNSWLIIQPQTQCALPRCLASAHFGTRGMPLRIRMRSSAIPPPIILDSVIRSCGSPRPNGGAPPLSGLHGEGVIPSYRQFSQ